MRSSLSMRHCLTAALATMASIASLTSLAPVRAGTYLGCYSDQFHAFTRDLSGALFLEETMTPQWCEQQCAKYGYPYFGLQYGSECCCGTQYGRYGKVEDDKCSVACGGDAAAKCGGEIVNSVYQVTDAPIAPIAGKHPTFTGGAPRPLLGLVMIVRNENHTLPNTLQAIKPYLDTYFILDTGSTDGTQDTIRRIMGDEVPGTLTEEPFIDYGRSRNRALELADTAPDNKSPIFSLMLSADETVYNAAALRAFCEQYATAEGNNHEAYPVQMDVGWRFDSVRLSRSDKHWRYVGRVHEYLAAPDQKWHPSIRVPQTYIKFKVTDPERRSNREYTILKILLEEVAEKPKDTRSSFYLARTYNVIGNHSAALDEFERRVSLGGWNEEVYESLYAIAWQKDSLHRPVDEVNAAFLRAYNYAPERAEPLYSLAQRHYKAQEMPIAYMYALHAAQLPYPKSAVLWVQQAVYDWQCLFITGMSAFKLGTQDKYEIGAKALMMALIKKPGDAVMVEQLKRYQGLISAEQWTKLEAFHEAHPTVLIPQLSSAFTTITVTAPSDAVNLIDSSKAADGVAAADTAVTASSSSSWFNFSSFFVLAVCLLFLSGIACVLIAALRGSGRKGSPFGGIGSDKVV